METLSAKNVDQAELARLDDVVAGLPTESELGAALKYVASSVRRGAGVALTEMDERVSPAQAANLLGMSRTHLYKLLDAEAIPSVRVGRDRRIAVSSLAAFDRRRHDDRVQLAERFAHADRNRSALIASIAEEGQD